MYNILPRIAQITQIRQEFGILRRGLAPKFTRLIATDGHGWTQIGSKDPANDLISSDEGDCPRITRKRSKGVSTKCTKGTMARSGYFTRPLQGRIDSRRDARTMLVRLFYASLAGTDRHVDAMSGRFSSGYLHVPCRDGSAR